MVVMVRRYVGPVTRFGRRVGRMWTGPLEPKPLLEDDEMGDDGYWTTVEQQKGGQDDGQAE